MLLGMIEMNPLIINFTNEDPFAKESSWKAVEKTTQTEYKGKQYKKIIYEHPLTRCQIAARLFLAFVASITIVPLLIIPKKVIHLWQSCSGIERKIVLIANSLKTDEGQLSEQNVPSPRHVNVNTLISSPSDCQFQEASAKEVAALQNFMQITNPKHPKLNLAKLPAHRMPVHKLVLGNATYFCSNTFELTRDRQGIRLGVFALVRIGNRVYPRLFYRSNSQATWRTLPAVDKGFMGLGHLGKGLHENDTQLPLALNLALQDLKAEEPQPTHGPQLESAKLDIMNITDLQAEMDRLRPIQVEDVVKTGWDYTESYQKGIHLDPFAEISESQKQGFERGGLYTRRPEKPVGIKLPADEGLHPDFTAKIVSKEIVVPHYGKLIGHLFPSKNKCLQYLFYEAVDGRVFLSAIEKVKDNPILKFGVYESACELEGFDAPLLEYWQQIPEDCEPKQGRDVNRYESNAYISNWNYVRQLIIIQNYYKAFGKELPHEV
jgi:hypothetical protein